MDGSSSDADVSFFGDGSFGIAGFSSGGSASFSSGASSGTSASCLSELSEEPPSSWSSHHWSALGVRSVLC